jgi:hypothetical protein
LLPIDGQAELLPQLLESLLVYFCELPAEFDEIRPADHFGRSFTIAAGFEVWQVREVGVAANVEEVLHPSFGGQAVVVPSHRIEDIHSSHAALARDEILVGVAEYVADVKRTAHGRRRRVHDESLVAFARGIPAIDIHFLPSGSPFAFDFFGHIMFRQLHHDFPCLNRPSICWTIDWTQFSMTERLREQLYLRSVEVFQ